MRQSRDVKTGFIKYYNKLLRDYNDEDEIVNESKQRLASTIIEKPVKEKSRYTNKIYN